MDKTKIINILDPVAAANGSERAVEETVVRESVPDGYELNEMFQNIMGHKRLLEVAQSTSEFPQLLQAGLRTILFSSYAGIPQTWEQWADVKDSNQPDETYLKDAHLGLLPAVAEGNDYPELKLNLDSIVTIVNTKKGGVIPITKEMILFDKYNVIRQMVEGLGRSAGSTKDQDAYNVLTTTTNYTLNSTTGDNDIGANTTTTTFSPKGLNLAFSVLRTMKGRSSGEYIGVNPDTLIIGPRMEVFVKQLIFSGAFMRVGGSAAAEEIGTGTDNPFQGMVRKLIVSPRMASPAYCWALMEAKRAVTCQNVWDLNILNTSGNLTSEAYLARDVHKWRADMMYGFGMVDEHFAFYSDSTTEPIVD